MIRSVSLEEIDRAMMSINDNKSLSMDGYNARFFKKCWLIFKEDILGLYLAALWI